MNEVKLKLLGKARVVDPSCNMMFNYDVDFREIGSTGKVFIYMRGTAVVGENTAMVKAPETLKKEIGDEEINKFHFCFRH